MSKQVTVYTTTTCAFCMMVKKYLDSKGIAYEAINLDEHPEHQEKAIELSGALATPITVITDEDDGTQEVVVGYNVGKLAPALGL